MVIIQKYVRKWLEWRAYLKFLSFKGHADQPNTMRNHANDPLEVPIGPITRARAKKVKEALNEHEGQ
jgi:hypothetical protein